MQTKSKRILILWNIHLNLRILKICKGLKVLHGLEDIMMINLR